MARTCLEVERKSTQINANEHRMHKPIGAKGCEGAGMQRLAAILLESEIVLLGVILFTLVLWYQFSKLNSRALLHRNRCEDFLHIYGRQACAQTCSNASVLKSSLQIRVGMCLRCLSSLCLVCVQL